MQIPDWLVASLAMLCFGAVAIGAVVWCYGRKLSAALRKIEKMENARQVSSQHALQTRKQIEQLQKDLAAQQARLLSAAKAAPAVREARVPLAQALAAGDLAHEAARRAVATNGFADTLPL